MEGRDWRRRAGSVLVLIIFVTMLSCFAGGTLRREETDLKTAESGVETEREEADKNLAEPEKDLQETERDDSGEDMERSFSEAGDTEPEEPVFGRGIESEEALSEDVVQALKNGDTEYLVGVPFGEEFDYDLYEDLGGEGCRRKETEYDWYLRYLFEGEGHRFSGFSIGSGGERFLGLDLEKCPASVFVKAFGEPDTCEKTDLAWEGGVLSADWYFEKAVLTVQEYEGYIKDIEYRALGDIADGDGTEKKSDFALRMEAKSENEKVETLCGFGFDEHDKDVFYPSEEDESGARNVDEFVEMYLEEQGFGDQMPDSTIYDEDGRKFAESYRNDRMDKFVFVIYNGDQVCCAVRNLQGTVDAGHAHIVYSSDENGNTVHETLYDKWGMRASEASYRYHDGVPFPFITESWNLSDEGGWYFCREHKTWFYEDCVEADKNGRVKATVETEEWNAKNYLEYPCFFTYRSDGKVERIQEEIPEDRFAEELLEYRESYFGHMEFSYDNGVLKKIEHHRSGQVYGTQDQSGTIDLDEQGRMVHRYYYVTSGCHDEFYFYHGEERRPWAVLDWCYDIWGVKMYLPME